MSQLMTDPLPASTDAVPESMLVIEEAQSRLGYRPPEPLASPLADTLRSLLFEETLHPVSVNEYKNELVAESERAAAGVERQMIRFLRAKKIHQGLQQMSRLEYLASTFSESGDPVEGRGLMLFKTIRNMAIGGVVGLNAGASVYALSGMAFLSVCLIGFGLLAGALSEYWREFRHLAALEADVSKQHLNLLQLAESNPILEWQVTPIKQYNLAKIPESVLAIAMEIAEFCPEVQFNVHYTSVKAVVNLEKIEERLRRQHADPFLEVTLGSESYFIAVWDEAGYRVMKSAIV